MASTIPWNLIVAASDAYQAARKAANKAQDNPAAYRAARIEADRLRAEYRALVEG